MSRDISGRVAVALQLAEAGIQIGNHGLKVRKILRRPIKSGRSAFEVLFDSGYGLAEFGVRVVLIHARMRVAVGSR